ncbi:MAG: PIN domain-containing protein [Candidatus Altiarchaeia archaeon]
MKYALDTDVAIDYLKGNREVIKRLIEIPELFLTPATVAELYYGAYNSGKPEKGEEDINELLENFYFLDMTPRACKLFGRIKAEQRQKGKTIGDFDVLIASTCITHNCVLITKNIRHYRDITGLSVEPI